MRLPDQDKNEALARNIHDILENLRKSYVKSITTSPTLKRADLKKFIMFEVGGKNYAISIDYVREIYIPYSITPVPNTSPNVKGIINLRGEIMSVLSLNKYLEIEEEKSPEKQWLIITKNTPFTTGLMTGGVEKVLEVGDEEIKEAGDSDYLAGILEASGQTIPVIDIVAIMQEEIVE